MEIQVTIEKDEDGVFVATVPSLPGCISQGKTEKQALKNIKEAIELHVRMLAEAWILCTCTTGVPHSSSPLSPPASYHTQP